jgi:16S rRNA A1518/A1519 N6-dimethyltransferase RsmA/KsgA/DIM1 with predicted DNA glycosylase/AP lyase activity
MYSAYPRIQSFLPAANVLEIAPGFGRMTRFLAPQCEHRVLVDLVERCIQACHQRFECYKHIEYHVNDGLSLEMVADRSIDFVFS